MVTVGQLGALMLVVRGLYNVCHSGMWLCQRDALGSACCVHVTLVAAINEDSLMMIAEIYYKCINVKLKFVCGQFSFKRCQHGLCLFRHNSMLPCRK